MSAPRGKKPVRLLSLGAGVQSTTVLLMSCLGELDKLDAAIFADTGWEPHAVYKHLDWLISFAADYGITVHRVSDGNIREDLLGAHTSGFHHHPPVFTLDEAGNEGQLRRQCTRDYKIRPVERLAKQLADGAHVEMWFGISADEQRRARLSPERWKTHRYPLIHEKPMTRAGCLAWCAEHKFPMPPRSACIGCPYRSAEQWRMLTASEREDANLVDDAIRHADEKIRSELFLHRERRPLRTINLEHDKGQGDMWNQECLGGCGV
jgi:hypothetical protein